MATTLSASAYFTLNGQPGLIYNKSVHLPTEFMLSVFLYFFIYLFCNTIYNRGKLPLCLETPFMHNLFISNNLQRRIGTMRRSINYKEWIKMATETCFFYC